MLAEPSMRSVVRGMAGELQRRDIARIASTLFCSNSIDPSIVSFAKHRTAAHWGLDEDHLDLLIAVRLLDEAARLIVDLRDLGYADAELPTAA